MRAFSGQNLSEGDMGQVQGICSKGGQTTILYVKNSLQACEPSVTNHADSVQEKTYAVDQNLTNDGLGARNSASTIMHILSWPRMPQTGFYTLSSDCHRKATFWFK